MSLAGTRPVTPNPTEKYQQPYPPLIAARDAGVIWTDENLFNYLRDPKAFLDRVTGKSFEQNFFYMGAEFSNERERRDVIAYFKEIKDQPECRRP